MTLQLSTRSGTPLSSPRASFTNIELANNQYLQWNASFANRLAGLKGQDEKIVPQIMSDQDSSMQYVCNLPTNCYEIIS